MHKNKLKPKEKIPLDFVQKFEVTSGRDDFVLIKISPQYKNNKVCTVTFYTFMVEFLVLNPSIVHNGAIIVVYLQGDIILEVPYLIEFVTKFINLSKNCKLLNINGLGDNQK